MYDVRRRRYLGSTDRITVEVTPGIAEVLALLPYEVTEVALTAADSLKQGVRLRYEVSLSTTSRPERHVLHVVLTDPEGQRMRHYTVNVNCEGGKYSGYVPLALNERPGKYTLSVRDVATGKEGVKTVRVGR